MSSPFSVRRLILSARLPRAVTQLLGTLLGTRKRAIEAERQIIEASLLFDSNWYLQKYADVAQAGVDPVHHYLTVGWHEGRDPGPAFTTSAYLKANEDVARAGVNPLLHFVQFGRAEGRESFGERHVPPSATREVADLASPHQCLSLPRPRTAPLVWRRSYRLDEADPRFVAVGKAGAGYVADSVSRAAFESAVDWLRCLSGSLDGDVPEHNPAVNRSGYRLVDAWYVNAGQLRTRWDGDTLPLVVRAFQCSPWVRGEIRLVGEGATNSPIDVIDLHLANPHFPILFALAARDGALLGTLLLTFPSLCRGGPHYPELLWTAARTEAASFDVVTASDELTTQLITLLRRDAEAAVKQIQVDKADADGNGPLFRKDMRLWLTNVLQIGFVESSSAQPRTDQAQDLQPCPFAAMIQRGKGGILVLPPDTAPTIAALIASRSGLDAPRSAGPAPWLASHMDPSKPVLLIDVPSITGPALQSFRKPYPWLSANPSGRAPAGFPPAAIRASNEQDLSDAQLLVPISGAALGGQAPRPAITWLVQPDDWEDDQLDQGLQCLALQRGAEGDVLALVGASAAGALGQARKYFPEEVCVFRDRAKALQRLKTPLTASVAGGVLLHDPRTADCFSSMLGNDLISTASCVMVSAEKRAGVVKTVIVDAGALVRADGQPAEPADSARTAQELWQGNWPVVKPSTYLWAARSREFLFDSEAAAGGGEVAVIHMCTSAVTATCLRPDPSLRSQGVTTASATSTRVEWLVG